MAKLWDSAQTAAQFAGGLVLTVSALVTPGGAVLAPAVGATVSGVGLIAAVMKSGRKVGLEDPAVLNGIRKKTLDAIEAQAGTLAQQFDLADADKALAEALPRCMLDRDQLVAAAQHPAGMIDNACALVMAALAAHRTEVFGETAPTVGRDFAHAVIHAALEAALENSDYFAKLQPKLILQAQQADARIEGKLDAHYEALRASIDELKRQRLGLSETQVRNLLIAFERQNVDVEQAERLLLKAAEELRDLRPRLSKLSNQDEPEIAAKREAARAAIDAGDFDRADQLLAEAEQADLQAGEQRIMRAAQTMAERAALARAQAKLEVCAEHYGRAANRVASIDPEAAWRWWFEQADVLYDHGKLFPGLGSLVEAVTIWRDKCLPHTPMNIRTEDWALAQNGLGNALQTIGQRAGGADGHAALDEAVAAYRAVLEVTTREDMPVLWAGTQNNLGGVLQTLGERAGGAAGLANLNEAVDAYRAALEIRTRQGMPSEWAMTQNNLGNALQALSRRLGGTEGGTTLGQAIEAYRAALEVRTRTDLPTKWAMTQNNLGIALHTLGGFAEGEEGLAALNQAVAAYRAAMEVYTREEMPTDWATTQNNLGIALRLLGARVDGADGLAILNEAVAAYSAALEVRTPEEMPAFWAFTTENLAIAEASISRISRDLRSVQAAIARIPSVIGTYKAMNANYNVENAKQNLATMRALLADLEASPGP